MMVCIHEAGYENGPRIGDIASIDVENVDALTEEANQFLQNNGCADYLPLNAISVGYCSRQSNLRAREEFLQSLI